MFYFYNELLPELSITECLVYSFIHAVYYRRLSEGESREFYASNKYISSTLGLSRRTIMISLRKLEEKNFINVKYLEGEENNTTRLITPRLINVEGILKKEEGGAKSARGVGQNLLGGVAESARGVGQNLPPNKDIDNKDLNIISSAKALISHSADGSNKQSVFKEDPKPKWNDIASRYKLPTITSLTTTRIRHLKARIKEAGGEAEFWAAVEGSLAASPFLRGENNRGWRANFDFFMQQSSFQKVLEGAYRQEGVPRQNSELTEQEKSLKALDDYIAKLKAEKTKD